MGSSLSSNSEKDENSSEGTPVYLNVYDLTNMNDYMIWLGFGIYHSGIEVHGLEYGYGAHDFPTSGVFEVEPKTCPGFTFRCSIFLGHVRLTPSEFREFIESTVADYHGDMYHLIYKNCNHFTDDVCFRLTGKHIPGWVNRLAGAGAMCSCCLLPESLQVPVVVKQTPPECQMCSEDGSETLSTVSAQEPTESDDTDQDKLLLSPTRGGGDVTFIKEVQR